MAIKKKFSAKKLAASAMLGGQAIDKQTLDAFSNALARTGFGTDNLLEGTNYPNTRLTRQYTLMNSLYRSNWIARKVIDVFAEDMLKNWLQVVSELEPEEIDMFDKKIDDTGTQEKLLESIKWARLYGGAGAIIVIKGHGNKLDRPLDIEDVGLDSYKGLIVFDRWSGISPNTSINTDIEKPEEFGLPESYQVTTERGASFNVHSSRVLRFIGRSLPQWEKQAENRWGISEYEVIFDELKKRDNTSWNIASLIFRANILGIKQKDLAQALSGLGKSQAALQQFYSMLQAQTHLMSNQGLMVLPEDGSLESHQYAFGGINDVYVSFMLDICGATEIPMSRLFGRSSSGLSGTNDGDEHTYYDLVSQKQKRELNPQLKKLFPIVAMSTWGEVPKDFDWQYYPVRTMSNEEQAELSAKKGTSIVEAYNSGIIGRKTALQEYKAISEETGMYSNITNQMIADAEEEPITMGEPDMGTGMADLPGREEKGEQKGELEKKASGKDPHPTKDHHFEGKYAGLDIHIENLAGTERSGENASGEPWSVTLTHPYGYVKSTEGVDGDEVDCFLGPYEEVPTAFVVHTQDPITGEYDEDKVMLGWPDVMQATQAFLENYSSPAFFRGVEVIPMKDLPSKLKQLRGKKLTADNLVFTKAELELQDPSVRQPLSAKSEKFGKKEQGKLEQYLDTMEVDSKGHVKVKPNGHSSV